MVKVTAGYITALFCLEAVLFAALGLPLLRHQVAPNHGYGFRTAKTMGDPKVWYAANEVMGRDMIAAGAAFLVVVLLVGALAGERLGAAKLALLDVTLMSVFFLATVVHGFWVLRGL